MPFSIPDQLSLADNSIFQEATGWFELGLMQDAIDALNRLSLEGKWHYQAMELRVNVFRRSCEFDMALDAAYEVTDAHADSAQSWLTLAAVYTSAGRHNEALDCLFGVRTQFASDRSFVLELSRCACDCGKLEAAREWLSLALSIGDPSTQRTVKLAALEDQRLAKLWAN